MCGAVVYIAAGMLAQAKINPTDPAAYVRDVSGHPHRDLNPTHAYRPVESHFVLTASTGDGNG
jgi:hypothetical protein